MRPWWGCARHLLCVVAGVDAVCLALVEQEADAEEGEVGERHEEEAARVALKAVEEKGRLEEKKGRSREKRDE
eukprot:3679853-Pleurochrysis_carterae.AAC.1